MDVRFISENGNGIYAYVEYPNGKKYEVDYSYLKNVVNVKKAINVEYELMDCHIVITKCDGLYETAICEKSFIAGKRKNWKTIKPAEEVESQPAEEVESQPAEKEVESQPAEKEIESQPAEKEIESQPAEEVESQPAGFKRYLCIVFEIKMQDGEYHRKYKRFDVSRETNIDNIQRFADSYTRGISGKAYIIDKVGRFYFIIKQKQYKPNADTKWSREEKNSTCKAFVDLFIQKGVH